MASLVSRLALLGSTLLTALAAFTLLFYTEDG